MKRVNGIMDAALVALSIALGFSFAAVVLVPDKQLKDWLDFSGSAFGAALSVLGALFVMMAQTRRQEAAEKRKREQMLIAARAVLASDLSQLTEYTFTCLQVIKTMYIGLKNNDPRTLQVMPVFNLDALLRFERLVALAEPAATEVIAELMTDLQIQRSRLSYEVSRYNGKPMGVAIGEHRPDHLRIATSATFRLYIKALNLFKYARREDPEPDSTVDRTRLYSAMFLSGLDDTEFQELTESIYPDFPPSAPTKP